MAGIRILTGVVFLLAAPDTRMPTLIRVLGGLFILAGVTIPLLGAEQIDKLAGWWLARSDNVLRFWALVAMVFGGLIVWAAV